MRGRALRMAGYPAGAVPRALGGAVRPAYTTSRMLGVLVTAVPRAGYLSGVVVIATSRMVGWCPASPRRRVVAVIAYGAGALLTDRTRRAHWRPTSRSRRAVMRATESSTAGVGSASNHGTSEPPHHRQCETYVARSSSTLRGTAQCSHT